MKSVLLISLSALMWCMVAGQDEWHTQDAFAEIRGKMDANSENNCDSANLDDLFLPEDAVSHHPDVKEIDIAPVFPNRTALMILHNMAINRAFFWSYILQSRFIRPAAEENHDPGMMYYFLSSVADLTTSQDFITASSLYFSPKMAYTSSFRDFFNKTLNRFAPRAYIQGSPSLPQNLFSVEDLGVFDPDNMYEDYTSDDYRINEWYKLWLPDNVEKRNGTMTKYRIEIRYANNINETFTFYGPSGNDETPGPVKWSRPYFDCGRLNKWLVAAVSPVADIFPRHTQFKHPTYTAAVVMEMDYDKIEINQCPHSQGNDRPNRFASTARCKDNTTECEPLYGGGFQRGWYTCRCRAGYHLPSTVRGPYLGEMIERVDSSMYNNNFDCQKIKLVQPFPERGQRAPPTTRKIYMNEYSQYVNLTKGKLALDAERINIFEVLNFIHGVKPRNCHKYHWSDLILNKDIAYGAEDQFEIQAKTAVRLANFISAYLQVSESDPQYEFTGNTIADKPLTEDQMFGETLAVMFGDSKIWSSGILWDRNKFPNRTFFAPFAYKTNLKSRKFKIEDLARLDKLSEEVYTHKPWFELLKQRWSTNYDNLERFFLKIKFRGEESGETLKRFYRYPTYYRAAKLEHGHWTTPYFDCNGHLKQWIITYAVPFFGWDVLKVKLEFKGVVAVSMSLTSLDINQCHNAGYVLNAFKNTNKCDKKSTYCVPLRGHGFKVGSYKCECRQGYEYPFEGPNTSFDGRLVEAEFQNIIANKETRIDMIKCRSIEVSVNQTQTQDYAKTNNSTKDINPLINSHPIHL